MELLILQPLGVVPVLINPIAVLLAVLPGIFMALLSMLKPKSIKAGIIMLWRMKIQVAILVALGFGIRMGVRAVWPDTGADVGEAEAAIADWPHFQGGPFRRGWVNDGQEDPVTGGINWTYRDGNQQLFIASPAVVGNRIYIPSVTIGAFGGLSGAIYCLDADTGALVWRGGPSDYRGSFSSAVVVDDRLFVGEGLHDTNDARLVGMDISDESNPEVLWMYQVNSHIEGTPAVDAGRVYINAGDDGVHAVDGETGEKLWHLPGEEFNDVETSILAYEGMLYVGLGFGWQGQAVIQVDGASGEVLHRIETPYPVFSPPAIHDGVLYVGMGNGDFVFSAEERVTYVEEIFREQGMPEAEIQARRPGLAPGGAVWALDIETMETIWEFDTDRTILTAIVVGEQGLYFASRTGGIYHLDFDGNLLARWNAGEPVVASLALAQNHVYAMTSGGMLYVLDAETLQPVWDLRVGTGMMYFSSPVVARGQILVGTESSGFVSVGEPDTTGRVAIWSGDGGGPRRAGRADDAPLPRFGAYVSHEPESAMGEAGDVMMSVTPLVVDDLLVRAFEKPDPRLHVSEPGHNWSRDLPAPATGIAVHGKTLAVTVGGDAPELLLFGLREGQTIAKRALSPEIPPMLQTTQEGIWIHESAESLSLLSADGELTAYTVTGTSAFPPVIQANFLITVEAPGDSLRLLDRPTGKALWTAALPAPATGQPFLDGHRILIPTESGLHAYRIDTGRADPEWEVFAEGTGDTLAVDRSHIALTTLTGEVVLLQRDTGSVVARHAGALPDRRPVLERGRLFWLSENGIHVLNRETPEAAPELWADASWIGTPTTGLLAHRSHFYLGLTDWGLVRFGEER